MIGCERMFAKLNKDGPEMISPARESTIIHDRNPAGITRIVFAAWEKRAGLPSPERDERNSAYPNTDSAVPDGTHGLRQENPALKRGAMISSPAG